MELKLKNLSLYRNVRIVIHNLLHSMVFRIFAVSFVVLFIFSTAIFYIEKGYTRAITIHGQHEIVQSNINSIEDSIWWAIVTSTTVGYGDKYPISRLGRIIGILTMFFGMALVGVITGNIASTLVEKQLKEDRGLKPVKIKNHYVICGWKKDMAMVLSNIAKRKEDFAGYDVVLVCMAESEQIENLKSNILFANIHYVYGDHIDEHVLNRANIRFAKKVLVLADELGKSGQDADSRTVMSVMSIKAISKSVYVCAEIIDQKYERYLRLSGCDEVILTNNYSKNIIADVFAKSGLAHVIGELIDVSTPVSLTTDEIPLHFINKPYSELVEYFANKNKILIGLLENTGNFYDRKRLALQEAQKTPDISKLVDNLRIVKTMIPNYPVLNPDKNYLIKNFSKAVLIEGSSEIV
jgi:voltage-gated potassium channel